MLAAISVGFDVSIGQLLLPLLRGAAVVVAPALRTLQADAFWALLARHAVTHINSVPSFFDTVSEALLAQPESLRYRGLKRLMLGGEALSGALVARLRQRLPGTQVVNMYGPTEACIDATAFVVPAGPLPAALPIGRPLPGYRAYVLDRGGRLAPPGVAGELCLAGAGLARGYLRRPADTAAKFVADPFGPAGARLYRTGDLARWRFDAQGQAQIEFLGRNDQQVKIRGFRVETGEVEAALLQHPAVQQAAVIAAKDASGQARLLAYLVAPAGLTPPDSASLKPWLAQRLPEHMLPSALSFLPSLPLTTNGKLDRARLPSPDDAALASRQADPPQGPVETQIATIWRDLLGAAQVYRDDDFFDLGGQSLLAISLVERLRQVGLALDVATLFAQPRLRQLALACEPMADQDAPLAVPPPGIPAGCTALTPQMLPMVTLTQAQIDALVAHIPGGAAQVQDIYPMAPLQEGMLFHHLMQSVGDVYLTPLITAFTCRAELDDFMRALQQVIARHDVLRTSIAWDGLPEPVQVVWREAELKLELRSAVDEGDAVAWLAAQVDAKQQRLDLRHAPLLRAVASQDRTHGQGDSGRWLLALCLHHLTLDHSSVDIVMQEVAALRKDPRALLPPPVPYRNVVWQARQGVSMAAHQAFFSEMLADVDTPTAPYGLLDTQGDAQEVQEARLEVDADLALAVRRQARAAGASPASLMHLAWALVLARTCQTGAASAGDGTGDDVVFGTVLFGRMNAGPGADRVLGMLINTLPLRLQVGQAGVAEALRTTHQRLVQLLRHEHAPLALAQRCSAVQAPTPLFSALFNYRHVAAATQPAPMALLWGEERTGYPLALAVDDDGQGFSLAVQAVQPAEPARVGALMLQAISQIVQALQSAPQTPCRALDLLGADERQRLLWAGNPGAGAGPVFSCLQAAFAAQVQAGPDAPAVFDGDLVWSYAELDARSSALAQALLPALQGLGPEPVVAVALPRSAATVCALLAVLKAGAVYLPLDVAYPVQRLQFLLDDAQAVLLIDALDGLCDPVCAGLQARRLSDLALPASLPAAVPALPVLSVDGAAVFEPTRAERLAYVIYTSGSTGLPKPVGVSHGAVLNLDVARQGHDPIGPGDRVLAAISVGFDVSIGQLLLPLLRGAAVVVAPALRTLQADAFWALLARHAVTHINSVPSFFDTVSEALLAQPESLRYRGLKRLMLGGEALSGALVARLRQRLPGTQVVNMYGPTEACIDATAFVVPAGPLPAALPIGRPLPGYRAYVLDRGGRLAPPGVAGELCLAGAGLARGYLRRPADTAAKFVADPFGPAGGTALSHGRSGALAL